ncbi:MAG: cytochrome b5-like heme/steroid binding domain-containing protein [archaeon]
MKELKLIVLISLIGIVLFSGCVSSGITGDAAKVENNLDEMTVKSAEPGIQSLNKTFSLTEVAEHNSESDCWLVIDSKVFDVTEFIPSHPGGQAIIEGCGKDATELFETRPMGSGTAHSDTARTLKENYFIGGLE